MLPGSCSVSACIVFVKRKLCLDLGLIPINRPSVTLWSAKNDIVDCSKHVELKLISWFQSEIINDKSIFTKISTSVSRLEDENDEKLEDGTCKELGSDATTAACGELSAAWSNLVFMFSSPRGHPFRIKLSCRAICYQNYTRKVTLKISSIWKSDYIKFNHSFQLCFFFDIISKKAYGIHHTEKMHKHLLVAIRINNQRAQERSYKFYNKDFDTKMLWISQNPDSKSAGLLENNQKPWKKKLTWVFIRAAKRRRWLAIQISPTKLVFNTSKGLLVKQT